MSAPSTTSSTERAIDPEIAAALAATPKTRYGAFDLDDLPSTRAQMRSMAAQMSAEIEPDPDIEISDVVVPRADSSELVVRCYRHRDAAASPALLWFHAGGQILTRADEDDAYLAGLASRLSVVVAAVDYRLAPEHRAPAAAEDGLAAYHHLLEHGSELGVDIARIAIGGASGGGAPALATAFMIRDQQLPGPRAISLLYPMIDDRNETASSHVITDVGVWDRPANVLAWAAVLGDRAGGDDVTAYEAPARQVDLIGLPPTFLAIAEYDVLRDEDLDLGVRLLRAGVHTELHHYAGAVHAWDRFAPGTALADELDAAWHGFLTRMLADGTPPVQ